MPHYTAQLTTRIRPSFRVEQLRGSFGLPPQEASITTINALLPSLDEQVNVDGRLTKANQNAAAPAWRIGAIVGPSGTGKSTIATMAFGDGNFNCNAGPIATNSLVGSFDWPRDAAIVDGFDATLSSRQIAAALSCVGLADVPAWLRPYDRLSTGQRFRADLARALLLDQQVVASDEFTSVVDRQVARFAAAAIAKSVRAGRSRCERFVAITCHYDVLEWLAPDWYFDTATGRLARGCLQRPCIAIDLERAPQSTWPMFKAHHYLSGQLNPAARCYIGLHDGRPIAFCATLANVGRRGQRRIHRVVVLPDFQAMGIGMRMVEAVAELESATHEISLRTSHPAVIASLSRSRRWMRTTVDRVGRRSFRPRKTRQEHGDPNAGRLAAGFRFRPLAD